MERTQVSFPPPQLSIHMQKCPLSPICISKLVSSPPLVRLVKERNNKDEKLQFSRLCHISKVLQQHQNSCHYGRSFHAAVAIYRAHIANSLNVLVNHHRSDISIIIFKCCKNDQWFILRTHIETGFTKCFAIQGQMKRSITERHNGSNVNKKGW